MYKQVNQGNAVISFKGYKVKKLYFQLNEKFCSNKESKVELGLEFDINIGIDKQQELAVITLQCILNSNFESENQPFYLDIELQSVFSFDSGIEDQLLHNLLSTNAVAILFPYLRATISTITVNCGIAPVVIPTINIVEVFKQSKSENA